MSESLKGTLEELSAKITEVYDLELAEEMADIYVDLVTLVDVISKRYWELVKTLAAVEVERDKLREKLIRSENKHNGTLKDVDLDLKRSIKAINHFIKQNRVLLGKIKGERDARTQAESEVEWLKRELEEERLLRVDAEYDKEYYAMQLMEHMD